MFRAQSENLKSTIIVFTKTSKYSEFYIIIYTYTYMSTYVRNCLIGEYGFYCALRRRRNDFVHFVCRYRGELGREGLQIFDVYASEEISK